MGDRENKLNAGVGHGNLGELAHRNFIELRHIRTEEGSGQQVVTDGFGGFTTAPLPSSGLTYLGTWDADSNTPTITSGVGNSGDYYIVGTAGSTVVDAVDDWDVGDWIIFNGTEWQKIDNSDVVGPVFVFQPGGTPGLNVFDDWVLLYNEVQLAAGEITIVMDDSAAGINIPAGVWDFTGLSVKIVGGQNTDTPVIVAFDDGAELSGVVSFERRLRLVTQSNTPVIQLGGAAGKDDVIMLLRDHVEVDSSGFAPFFDVNGDEIQLTLSHNSAFIGTDPGISIGTGGSIAIQIHLYDGAEIPADTIEGTSGTVAVNYAADASYAPGSQSTFSGSIVEIPLDIASRVFFDDTVWSFGVDNVQDAIDALASAADPFDQYLLVNGTRAMTGNLNMGSQNIINTADITSNSDATRNVGTNSNRYLEMVARRVRGIDSAGAGTKIFTMPAGSSGGMFGFAYAGPGSTVEIALTQASPNFRPAFIAGLAYATGTGPARLRNQNGGCTVIGSAFSNGAGTALLETTTGYGAFCGGYAFSPSGGSSTVRSEGSGAFCWGYAVGGSSAASSVIAAGPGSFVAGRCAGTNGTQLIETTAAADGAFAAGIVQSGLGGGTIRASGVGSFAQGRAAGGSNATGSALLLASGAGAFAQGFVTGGTAAAQTGTITASGQGSFAHGSAVAGAASASILASGLGAFAVGAATSGQTITASATNSSQFGPGTNAEPDTLSVGGGIRIKGTNGAPGTPRVGDIWVNAGGYMQMRTPTGFNLSFTRPTITGSRGGNAALASLLTALATMNLIVDSTVA